MQKIKSIIVDDEKHGRENLAGILEKHCPEVVVLGQADSVDVAAKLIREFRPDLVFLDIEMPKENGFQLLERFDRTKFEVIFITAYDNYAIKAIRFSAVDYLLKPINFRDLTVAVEKVVERIRHREENKRIQELFGNLKHPENPRIGLPTGDRIEFVAVSDIIHCKGEGNYTHLYFVDGRHLMVAKTLVEFQDLLQDFGFMRTHKSHLVSLKHVSSYIKSDGGYLKLSNGDNISISRRRHVAVVEMLKSYLA